MHGFLELIKASAGTALPGKLKCYIDEALKSSKHMARVISDILYTSKPEEGQMKLRREACDLNSVLRESISKPKPLHNIEIRFPPLTPPQPSLLNGR